MKKITALAYAVLLLLVGCVFGDAVAVRTVSLNFPTPEGQSKVSISVDDNTEAESSKSFTIADGIMPLISVEI